MRKNNNCARYHPHYKRNEKATNTQQEDGKPYSLHSYQHCLLPHTLLRCRLGKSRVDSTNYTNGIACLFFHMTPSARGV